jgi:NhaP-type Na+/H+ or K+/H+ antiporter
LRGLQYPELGESLVNDATALVAYRFAMTAIVTGSFSPVEAALRFVLIGR